MPWKLPRRVSPHTHTHTPIVKTVEAVAGTLSISGTDTTITGDITAARLLDQANTAYFIDPAGSGTSLVTAGKVAVATTSATENFTVAGNIGFTGGSKIKDSAGQLQLQAGGTGTGSTGTGSIYFLNSSGTTTGRFDTSSSLDNGDGSDGAVTITISKNLNTQDLGADSDDNSTYADGIAFRVNAPADSATSVTRYSGSDTLSNGIVAGDKILLINMQGASGDSTDVGNYEIMEVQAVTASSVTFTSAVTKSYDGTTASNQLVVVQRIPQYTNVIINSGGTITVSAWDALTTAPTGNAGYYTGIVAFLANGTVTVNSGGSINVSQKGMRGTGEYYAGTWTTNGATGGSASGFRYNRTNYGGNNGGAGGGSGGGSGAGSGGSGSTGGSGKGGGGGGLHGSTYNATIFSHMTGGIGGEGGGGGAGISARIGSYGNTCDNNYVSIGGGGGGGKAYQYTAQSEQAQTSSTATTITLGAGGTKGAGGGAGGSGGRVGITPNDSYPTDYSPKGDYDVGSNGGGSPNGTGGTGASVTTYSSAASCGNAGGGGNGGAGTSAQNGGGIVLIYSNAITVAGTITATGGTGGVGGTGGSNGGGGQGGQGGGGGSIFVKSSTVNFSNNTVEAKGGNGGNGGSGAGTSGGAGGSGGTYSSGGDVGGGGSGGGVGYAYSNQGGGNVGVMCDTTVGGCHSYGTPSGGGGAGGKAGYAGVVRIEYKTNSGSTISSVSSPAASSAASSFYGNLYLNNTNTSSQDLAEYYISGDDSITAGDVVAISNVKVQRTNENGKTEEATTKGVLRKADKPYDGKLIGIISTNPGVLMGSIDGENKEEKRMLALSGRVPVKIDPDSTAIAIGDFLTSGSRPGLAAKATRPGYVVARALENWKHGGPGTIEAFLQLTYYMGDIDPWGNFRTLEVDSLKTKTLEVGGVNVMDEINDLKRRLEVLERK